MAAKIGYPVIVKAAAGGGGLGMKVAYDDKTLRRAFPTARAESKANFGDDTLYMEKFLEAPRHIEIQILADNHSNIIHLGERDCSLQRRHQKVIEEAPSPALNSATRDKIGARCVKAMKKIGYRSVGTIEFLYENGKFYFIEMNTRLQVEHPISEMISGIDLAREQIRVAAGAKLDVMQKQVQLTGHAIECRINAENPETFLPSPGVITDYHAPGGLDVRVDSALYSGYRVPPYYDSLIAKLIVRGRSRNECLMRLRRGLGEFVIDGIETTIPLHQRLITETDFINGDYDIHWLENLLGSEV
jgi:acetyl-CoA carboxylase biotin carboxylase subunit